VAEIEKVYLKVSGSAGKVRRPEIISRPVEFNWFFAVSRG
jgi:hypothetical protein